MPTEGISVSLMASDPACFCSSVGAASPKTERRRSGRDVEIADRRPMRRAPARRHDRSIVRSTAMRRFFSGLDREIRGTSSHFALLLASTSVVSAGVRGQSASARRQDLRANGERVCGRKPVDAVRPARATSHSRLTATTRLRHRFLRGDHPIAESMPLGRGPCGGVLCRTSSTTNSNVLNPPASLTGCFHHGAPRGKAHSRESTPAAPYAACPAPRHRPPAGRSCRTGR